MTSPIPLVVLGAGPAGLGAALQLARRRIFDVTVVERADRVGGNAGSFELDGLRVDYGSHRLHPACPPQVLADIGSMLGSDLLDRPRHGRIRLRGRWVHFPLRPLNLALELPPSFLLGVARDGPTRRSPGVDESFASALERGLGRTICRDFYFPYAEKIWGLPPSELDVEQARRRISAGSISRMIRKALSSVPGFRPPGSGRFFYPRHGYGQISEAYHRAAVAAGVTVRLRSTVAGVEIENGRATAVVAREESGQARLPARQILSTLPLPVLVRSSEPPPPPEVLDAASALKYRAMILIYLVLATDRFTEYDAHYFPGPEVPFTRISEPKNYGLSDRPGLTVLCAELPCSRHDEVWNQSDEELGTLAAAALSTAGLPVRVPIRRVVTRRISEAYPIYTRGYRRYFDLLDRWTLGIEGLVSLGRQGLFAHDNTHHALAMAYAASECLGADGALDRERWAGYRRLFESHVVED